jgi:hypothetical protein
LKGASVIVDGKTIDDIELPWAAKAFVKHFCKKNPVANKLLKDAKLI